MTGSALLAVFGAVLAAIVLPRAQAPVTVIVSGHVVDAVAGAPVAGAQVGLSVAGPDGARRSSMTDDTGRFVIENVPPGRYYLFAMKPGFFTAGFNDAAQPGSSDVLVVTWPASAPITLTLRPHGSISGRASDDEGRAVAGAKVTLLSRRRVWPSWGPAWSWEPVPNINQVTTTATGEYRLDEVPSGEYLLLIDASGVERSGPAPRTLGTVYSQDVIRLGVGEARRADTELPVRSAFEVTFSIDRSVDGPVFVQLLAVGEERRRLVAEQWPPGDEPATFRRLPPGDYLLKAAIGDRAHGEQPFTIVDRSRDDIGVRLFPSVVISGRVVWEGAARPPERASLQPAIHVLGLEEMSAGTRARILESLPITIAQLLPLEPGVRPTPRRSYPAVWSSDSTFTVTVPRGRFIAGHGMEGSWLVKSLVIDGREATAEPIDIDASTTNAALTMTRATGEVRGTVLDAAGVPDKAGWLLLFSTDPRVWPGAHATGFHVTSAVGDDEGRFVFERVLPGDYYVAPVRWADVERRDPEVLQRIASTATRVRVLPNAPVTVTLKRAP